MATRKQAHDELAASEKIVMLQWDNKGYHGGKADFDNWITVKMKSLRLDDGQCVEADDPRLAK